MKTGTNAEAKNDPFKILTVCTGNICRSPTAERLLTATFDAVAPMQFTIASAGTRALIGAAIDHRSASIIESLGGQTSNFTSRQIERLHCTDADLILALSREHRSKVVEIDPASLKKTFTVREFARILHKLPVPDKLAPAARLREAIPRALRRRGADRTENSEDDVTDPYRKPDSAYDQMSAELIPALRMITEWASCK